MMNTLADETNDLSSRADSDEDREVERKLKQLVRKFNREVESGLQKDRKRLLSALQEFANLRSDAQAWSHFRRRWPRFFPSAEFDRAVIGEHDSVRNYPTLVGSIWKGYDGDSLLALLGMKVDAWKPDRDGPLVMQIHRIPAQFFADWEEGVFRYRGMCDFQRALYLLFRESWRARFCEKCQAKFIAARAAQKFCTTDCSEAMQREFRRRWWAEHGNAWRRKQKVVKSTKGKTNVTRKTR
jgi:hypothetical protein